MDIPFIDESLKRVPVPEFTRNVILSQQNFEWMIMKHNHFVEECPKHQQGHTENPLLPR
jgi:hypothetical protein